MLTIRTFKLFCLKAGTKKAEQIHEYYIKLEETLQEIVQEESDELKLQLETKDNEIAFKTTGELTRDDLIINKNGKIVSKKKCIQETLANRFEKLIWLKRKPYNILL